MPNAFSSIGGGPGGGILGSLFGGGGSQVASTDRSAVASQDVLAGSRPFYAQQLLDLYKDPSGFLAKIPGYDFMLKQGEDAVTRNAAATGGLGSGNLSIDLVKFAEGFASQNIDHFTTILAGLAESGDPRYASILSGAGHAQAAGNQAIGGNAVGFLSSLFGGGGNNTSGSGLGGMLGKLFGGTSTSSVSGDQGSIGKIGGNYGGGYGGGGGSYGGTGTGPY